MLKPKNFYAQVLTSKNIGPTLGIVVGVHGNEAINIGILDFFKEVTLLKGKILLIIANPKAVKANKRFIESDLNRVFPGVENGNHEERLAHELTPLMKHCNYLIDFHAFEKKSPPFTVLPINTQINRHLAMWSEVVHNVYMPGQRISLVEQSKNGIGIELGNMNDSNNVERGINICKKVMAKLGMLSNDLAKYQQISRRFYFCDKKLVKPEGFRRKASFKNFHLVNKGQIIGTAKGKNIKAPEDFYPILLESPSLGASYLCRIGKHVINPSNMLNYK